MKHNLSIVRVYDIQPATPGWRVLVDRLWPRGVPKDALHPDLWAKDVAPSTELRKWFAHEEGRFDEFAETFRLRDTQGRELSFLLSNGPAKADELTLFGGSWPEGKTFRKTTAL